MKGFSRKAQDRYAADVLNTRAWACLHRGEELVRMAERYKRPTRWDLVEIAACKAELLSQAMSRLGFTNPDLDKRVEALWDAIPRTGVRP